MPKTKNVKHLLLWNDQLFLAAAAVFFSAAAVIIILSRSSNPGVVSAQADSQRWLEEIGVLGASTQTDAEFEQLATEAQEL